MSQPAAVSSAICWSVALTSEVSVVVIDCTETGASPPTPTLPTLIWRVLRRGASTGGGAAGMPRLIGRVMTPGYGAIATGRLRRSATGSAEIAGAGRRGRRRSAPHRHQRSARPRRRRPAAAWRRRRSRGRAAPRTRAMPRRSASHSAPAMWPPSSGSSGMKLNIADEEVEAGDQAAAGRRACRAAGSPGSATRLAGEPAAADDADRAVGVALLEPRSPWRRRRP